jgi:hypothetical protein
MAVRLHFDLFQYLAFEILNREIALSHCVSDPESLLLFFIHLIVIWDLKHVDLLHVLIHLLLLLLFDVRLRSVSFDPLLVLS